MKRLDIPVNIISTAAMLISFTIYELVDVVEIKPGDDCFKECKKEIDLEIVFTQDVTWTYQLAGDTSMRGVAKNILGIIKDLKNNITKQYNGTRFGYTTFADYDVDVKGKVAAQEDFLNKKNKTAIKGRYEENEPFSTTNEILGFHRPIRLNNSARTTTLCYNLVTALTSDGDTVVDNIYEQTWFYQSGQKDDEESAATGILYTAADPNVKWTEGNIGKNGKPLLKIIVLLTNEDTVQENFPLQSNLTEPMGLGNDTCQMKIPTDEVIKRTLQRQDIRLLGLITKSKKHGDSPAKWRKHFSVYLNNDSRKYAVQDVEFNDKRESQRALDAIQRMIDQQAAHICTDYINCNKTTKINKRQTVLSWRRGHLLPRWRNAVERKKIQCNCVIKPTPPPTTTTTTLQPPVTTQPPPATTLPPPAATRPPTTTTRPTTTTTRPPTTTTRPTTTTTPPTTASSTRLPTTKTPALPTTIRTLPPPLSLKTTTRFPTTRKTSSPPTTQKVTKQTKRRRTRKPKNTIGLK